MPTNRLATRLAARVAAVAGIGTVVLVAAAAPAHGRLDGPCSGAGTFESQGRTYDPATTDEITVPDEDSVAYVGEIDAPPGEERSHHGKIELKLPPPLPSVAIEDWESDSTDETSDEGTYDYDLPAFVPRGVTLNLEGEHVDTAGTCTGAVEVEIEGGPLDSPVPTAIAAAGTAAGAAALVVAGRPRRVS
jgi:hypothetical protein